MNRDRIGVALVGCGRAGLIHAKNFQRRVRQAEVVAVCDPVENKARDVCRELGIEQYYLDYPSLFADDRVDATVVASPTKYHRDIVVAAAQAGKHVLCEKPMAMTTQECDEMIAAAKDNNIRLVIGFMRRFDEGYIQAKRAVESGDIGDVVLVKSVTRGPSIPQPWQYDIAKSNGVLAEVNSHDIDTLRWFSESEFASVFAIAGNYRCPEARHSHPDYYDNLVMSATFTHGMQGLIDGAASVRYGYDARMEILGTRGVVFVGQVHEGTVTVCNQSSGLVRPITKSWRQLFSHAYLAEDTHFLRCILGEEEPRVTGRDGKMAVAVVDAGNRSIREQGIVQVDYNG